MLSTCFLIITVQDLTKTGVSLDSVSRNWSKLRRNLSSIPISGIILIVCITCWNLRAKILYRDQSRSGPKIHKINSKNMWKKCETIFCKDYELPYFNSEIKQIKIKKKKNLIKSSIFKVGNSKPITISYKV